MSEAHTCNFESVPSGKSTDVNESSPVNPYSTLGKFFKVKIFLSLQLAHIAIESIALNVWFFQISLINEAKSKARLVHLIKEKSFGLSAWTMEKALDYCSKGDLYLVKIYIEDIGAIVHDGTKIRCFRQTFLEKI